MFAKISVKGADQHPLYTFLTNKQSNPGFDGDISWNFNKFLLDRSGKVVARFGSADTPEGEKLFWSGLVAICAPKAGIFATVVLSDAGRAALAAALG